MAALPLRMQAGARSVSQPPTPTERVLAGDAGQATTNEVVPTSLFLVASAIHIFRDKPIFPSNLHGLIR